MSLGTLSTTVSANYRPFSDAMDAVKDAASSGVVGRCCLN